MDVRLMYASAGYAVFLALRWSTSNIDRPWLAYAAAIVDTTAVAVFGWLAALPGLTLWPLYFFPLLLAGAKGRWLLITTGVLSAAGYVTFANLTIAGENPGALWPIAALAAATVAVGLLPSPWRNATKERQALHELAATQEALARESALVHAAKDLRTFDPAVVYAVVLRAIQGGLNGSGAVLDTGSDGLLAGEPGLIRGDSVRGATRLTLGGDAALIARVQGRELWDEERRWLGRLAELATTALEQCAEYCALQVEETRLRNIWQACPAPAALHTIGAQLVLANETYAALQLGAAQPAPSPVHPDQLEVVTGDPPRIFALTTSPVAGGEYVLSLYREITRERREVEARDELLSLVGHELRGPLTSIHGFSQMMVRNLGVVQQQVGQLDRLIGDLMSKSAVESGQLSLDLQAVDLQELAGSAAERFRVAHPDRPLRLQAESVATVHADPTRLNQVIDNLLNNAAKYSPAEAEITITVESGEDDVLLSVQDRGAGIAAEHLPQLFDRFYRVPGVDTQQVKGLGLGLSIVRDLVAAHAGRVWAESAGAGRGSTFRVSLPRKPL